MKPLNKKYLPAQKGLAACLIISIFFVMVIFFGVFGRGAKTGQAGNDPHFTDYSTGIWDSSTGGNDCSAGMSDRSTGGNDCSTGMSDCNIKAGDFNAIF